MDHLVTQSDLMMAEGSKTRQPQSIQALVVRPVMIPSEFAYRRGRPYAGGSGMTRPSSPRKTKRSRGQAMTEFAIVAPILFFFLLGVLESGLLLFVVGSARWGVAEVARQESESGSALTADQDSITVLRKTAIGTTTLSSVNEIDIFHLTENAGTGTLTIDALHYNKYKLDGSCFAT